MGFRMEGMVEEKPEHEKLIDEIIDGLPHLTTAQLKGILGIVRTRREAVDQNGEFDA